MNVKQKNYNNNNKSGQCDNDNQAAMNRTNIMQNLMHVDASVPIVYCIRVCVNCRAFISWLDNVAVNDDD